jgi:hypothetical protein
MKEEAPMTYAYIQDVPISAEVYRKIMEKIGPEPIAGQLLHLVLRKTDGKLRYVDVWESKTAHDEAFATRIHPAVFAVFSEIGFQPSGEPSREEIVVHELVTGPHGARAAYGIEATSRS